MDGTAPAIGLRKQGENRNAPDFVAPSNDAALDPQVNSDGENMRKTQFGTY